MPPKENNHNNFLSAIEALYKLGGKGVSLDGVHVGRCIQLELNLTSRASLGNKYMSLPVVELKFTLDKEGIDNLCEMHKFLEVME